MTTLTPSRYDFGAALTHFFRTFGSRPAGTLWVMIWNGLLYVILFALVIWALWPFYSEVFALAAADTEPDAAAIFSMLFSATGGFLIAVLGGLIIALMAQGAWLRLLARGEVAAMIPIRLGSDEFRLLGINLLFLVLGSIAYVAFAAVFGIIVVSAAAAGGDSAGVVGGLGAFAAIVALIVAGAFIAVKFAPAPALSILDRRFRFFDAWPVTKGVFWWALLTYIVMAILIFAVAMVFGSIAQLMFLPAFLPVIAEFAAYGQSHSGDPAPQEAFDLIWAGLTHPVAIVFLLLGTVLSLLVQTFYEGMWHSVGAYLARRHRGLECPAPATVAPAANTGDAPADSGSSPA